jgi:hypothetical protein
MVTYLFRAQGPPRPAPPSAVIGDRRRYAPRVRAQLRPLQLYDELIRTISFENVNLPLFSHTRSAQKEFGRPSARSCGIGPPRDAAAGRVTGFGCTE